MGAREWCALCQDAQDTAFRCPHAYLPNPCILKNALVGPMVLFISHRPPSQMSLRPCKHAAASCPRSRPPAQPLVLLAGAQGRTMSSWS